MRSWCIGLNYVCSEQIRIWARKKAIEDGHGDYALNITGPILKFFENYYSVPYPLSKSGMFKHLNLLMKIIAWEKIIIIMIFNSLP